ncbi:hypothetical protein [Brevibacterium aurantiacum]|uniref:Uncharacterized protein n=1 Tax=Brevibacterium aurantiacum TaxID=273384 RepID=A0A2A3WZC7_BREAU|nr:hypothetical protein [Brevibacterium aurantiacum]PCC16883.1 hypothetical protein CIK79_00330 [Brevibacterium aurantiacum]
MSALLVEAAGAGILSDPREFRIALEDTWTSTEWPGRAATRELWLALFEMALELGTYLEETELRPVQALPETLSVYRAAAAGHEDGISWTQSFEKAHWFATRLSVVARRPHRIFKMDAPRNAIIAAFDQSRGEQEYVINTTLIEDTARREVRPEEWEYLVERPAFETLGEPELIGMREPVIEQLGPLEATVRETPTEGYSRAEAVGFVLRSAHGMTTDAVVVALDAIEELYQAEAPGRRLSGMTLANAIATAQDDKSE